VADLTARWAREFEANRKVWDDLARQHARGYSPLYDVPAFKAGGLTLDLLVRAAVGPVEGRSLLHLHCHFGLDTLSWVRLGAVVTGVDFAPTAIALARDLAHATGLAATFVCANVYELPGRLTGPFDVVFASYGVLAWIPDVGRWAEIAAHFTRPGGRLALVDYHPLVGTFDVQAAEPRLRHPYFAQSTALRFEPGPSYGGPAVRTTSAGYEWTHSLGDVVTAVAAAGFRIDALQERPVCNYQAMPWFAPAAEGGWRAPTGLPDLPPVFALRATREPGTGPSEPRPEP